MTLRLVASALLLTLTACSSDDSSDSGPDFNTVFATRPPATPDKLRGVWESTTKAQSGVSTATRLFFTDGHVVGGARCIPADQSKSVTTGSSTTLDTTGLDTASGNLKMGSLNASTTESGIACALSLAGNTYAFQISEKQLTLSVSNSGAASVAFTKVGD